MTQRWRNASGQRVRVANARQRCATCPCGGQAMCDGPFNGALWRAILTVDFAACTPPSGATSCDGLNVTDQVLTWSSTPAWYEWSTGSFTARCNGGNPYFGYHYKKAFKVNVVCPTVGNNGRIELYVRAQGVVEFDSLIAQLTGLGAIETGTLYTLTPLTNCNFPNSDCLCAWDASPTVEFEAV